ncbi:Ig lambda chain V region 4A [Fukomys damarensis]|uniref:Ig lambda chain V region 4A n=1 Tax=Fukomys damarensis TaxID=885580 RepID=A0A091CVL7_FUKDA|nr:Ig lambda chain V region 4A [Fukomys damarensis]
MAWTMVLLGIFAFSSGVVPQTVVTQEPSASVSSKGTVTLTCGLSSGSVSTGNYPSWYQQNPGQAPYALIYQTNNRPSGVPDRFSGSISENKAALTITGAQPEDEADYYCLLYTGSSTSHSDINPWGNATKTFLQ